MYHHFVWHLPFESCLIFFSENIKKKLCKNASTGTESGKAHVQKYVNAKLLKINVALQDYYMILM